MKVLLTGASGFIGSHLTARLIAAGHEVLPVGRSKTSGSASSSSAFAASRSSFDWSEASLREGVRIADAVVNLAGENLFAKRWSAKQKKILRTSRIDGTRRLAALIAERKPACFVSGSAIGYYGASADRRFQEGDARGTDFLAELCGDWEEATDQALEAGVRTATVRIGLVLGLNGGALAKMLPLFRVGMGGPLGDGRQWVSWIHLDDLASLFLFLLENAKASGPFNGTAPHPVTMSELSRTLGKVMHRPSIFPAPAPLLRLTLGEVADVMVKGQHVTPKRAIEHGFQFKYPDLEPALADIVRGSRNEARAHSAS